MLLPWVYPLEIVAIKIATQKNLRSERIFISILI
jgi:hypothetical protein